MKKERFDITGMTCSACSSRVEGCIVKLPGVKDVSVNLLFMAFTPFIKSASAWGTEIWGQSIPL